MAQRSPEANPFATDSGDELPVGLQLTQGLRARAREASPLERAMGWWQSKP